MPPKEPENSSAGINEDSRFDQYATDYFKRFEDKYPEFTSEQVKKALLFCEELAIERIKLEDSADNDPLTDLLNKRGFAKYTDQKLQQYQREAHNGSGRLDQIKASIIFLDLDYFKIVNDRYDHDTGDEVLIAFSEFLKKDLRPSDIIARWGGEEMAIYADGEDTEGAIQAADRIRRNASELFHAVFPHLNWPKTVSCGVYQLPVLTSQLLASYEDRKSLIKQAVHYADLAHYKGAKEAGRNKVGVMTPDGSIYTAQLRHPHREPLRIYYQKP